MKTTKLLLVMLFSIAVTACGGGGGGSSTPSCASVPGVTNVNIGSSIGSTYAQFIGSTYIQFDNTGLNLQIGTAGNGGNYIVDVGSGCLASITTYPTSGPSVVAMVVGHNYVFDAKADGTHYKLSADAYSSGVLSISWVQMFSAKATTTAQNLWVGTAMTSFSPLTPLGGATPYTYSYTGILPTGLSFSTSTGAVTGTPTAAYPTASLVFSVKDANNVVASTTSTVSFTVATVYVNQGGLTWMPVTSLDNWTNANAYCTNTTINGQTGWRQPTQPELSALYTSGAMNGHMWTLGDTWSSTVFSTGMHYYFGLSNGASTGSNDGNYAYVSCVHL